MRGDDPTGFAEAGTVKWAAAAHFLLVKIDGALAEVMPIGEDGAALATLDGGGATAAAVTRIEA